MSFDGYGGSRVRFLEQVSYQENLISHNKEDLDSVSAGWNNISL